MPRQAARRASRSAPRAGAICLAVARVQRLAFPPRFAYTLSTLLILRALPWVRC